MTYLTQQFDTLKEAIEEYERLRKLGFRVAIDHPTKTVITAN